MNIGTIGADPTGVIDATAALQAAHDALKASGGGVIQLSPGRFNLSQGPLVLDNSCVSLFGSGRGATTLFSWYIDNTVLSIGAGWTNARIADLTIYGKGLNQDIGTFGATKSAVTMAPNSGVNCRISDVTIWGGYYALDTGAVDCTFVDLYAGNSYGPAAINCTGDIWVRRGKFDTGNTGIVPVGLNSPWQPSQSVVVGNMRTVQGVVLCCSRAGVTGETPPILTNIGIEAIDGTAGWFFSSSESYSAIIYGPGSGENNLDVCDLSGSFSTSLVVNSPTAMIEGRSCTMSNGMSFNGNWGHFSGGHYGGGVNLISASRAFVLDGLLAIDGSDVVIQPGVSNFSIVNCHGVGNIKVLPGPSNHYVIVGNPGAVISDQGTGSSKNVLNV